MIDLIGTIFLAGGYALTIGVLVALSPATAREKWLALVAAVSWGAVIVIAAALGGLEPGATGPVPGVGIAFVATLGLLLGCWLLLPAFRRALLAMPLSALVGLNVLRVGGVFFLLLAAQDRLPAPFAPSAGWGDIVTGLLAIPLALVAGRGIERIAAPLALWNAFGILDLVTAVSLGLLSAPGTPFRLFTAGPGTAAMGEMPWVMIPGLLVPVFFLIHLAVATRLRRPRRNGGTLQANHAANL